MTKSAKVILLLLALAVAACAAVLLLRPRGTDHPVARITLDGALVEEIDLERVGEAYAFTLDGPGGFSNTILVEEGRIRVSQAGCPDQVCVNQGFISDGATPIVCLPNRLIIQITGGGDGLDAATG